MYFYAEGTGVAAPPLGCSTEDAALVFCAEILFFWAPSWAAQIKRLPELAPFVPSAVFAHTGNSYEKVHDDLSEGLKSAWATLANVRRMASSG